MKNPIVTPALRLLAACFTLCASAQANTFIVTNTAATGAGSLHQAVADAAASDTINFANGLFGQSINLNSTLVLNKNLTIDASALSAKIKLIGNGRVMEVTGGQTVVLRGLEISEGYDAVQGAGILNAGTLTLHNCTISNNGDITEGVYDPDRGGGIYNTGSLTINQCSITGNVANMSGAAIYNQSGATLTVNNSTITGNECLNGTGGIRNAGSLTLNNTILAGNTGGGSDPNLDNTGGSLSLIVTSAADSGPGSLRDLVASASAGASIVFASTLSGQTISLTGGEISLNSELTLDASALPGGLTIAGNGTGRLLNIGASGNVTLVGLAFTGGNIGGGAGGAIYTAGGSSLHVSRCTFSNNHGNEGGAILNNGSLLVENSTFSGNTGGFGGALQCRNLTTLIHCTFSGNDGYYGGAIYNNATTLTVDNSIIAGNTAGGGIRDILNQSAALVFANANLVQSVTASTATEPITGPAPLTHAPRLAPLGNYGGPTQTMPPLFSSPAIDAAVGSSPTTDQRRFAITGRADIGAVENGSLVTTGLDQLDTPPGSEVSLREAVRDCPPGGGVGFASALSSGTCTLTTAFGGEIVLSKSVTIDASSLPNGMTIDGGTGDNRIFSIPAGQTVTLNRLTLTGGGGTGATSSGYGGAIYNTSSLLSLTNCSFQGNSASNRGGGICNEYSSPVLTNCSFQGNSASNRGGGIFNQYSSPTLTNCSFQGNSASYGGAGIFNYYSSSPTLTNCSFQGNSASYGGGIYNYSSSSPNLTNCSFQGGSADLGGGIYNDSSSPTLTNCSFQGNSASNRGGGIYNIQSSPTLTNCSFQGNRANQEGGGICNSSSSSPILINNCIIWNNTARLSTTSQSSSVFNEGFFGGSFSTPTYSHCLIQGYSKTDLDAGNSSRNNLDGTNPDNNPLFVLEVDPSSAPTTGGNLRLLAGSPAIDEGDNTKNLTTTDLAGDPRFSGTIDLGAHEMPAPVVRPVTIATNGNPGWAKPGDIVTLTFTANEPIQTPVVTIFGNTATVTNAGGNVWNATVTVNGGTTEGVATFSITATDLEGSIAAPVTATTDGTAVTVDKTQPILTAPVDKILGVHGSSNAAVSFSVGTSDNLDPAPVLVANPASGSLFPIGETTVNLSLTDAAGNASASSFKVTVRLLSAGDDTDSDGLNDLAEFQMSTLGFNWQVSQPELVNTLMTNANTAGLFTTGQVETLHSGTPLISRNPATGKFKLTMDWKKSTDLTNFLDFPAPVGSAVSINPQGDVEFEFPSTGNAAFFRIELE